MKETDQYFYSRAKDGTVEKRTFNGCYDGEKTLGYNLTVQEIHTALTYWNRISKVNKYSLDKPE